MSKTIHASAALLLLTALGCSSQGTFVLPTQPIDKAIIYKEQAYNGSWRALSHAPPKTSEEEAALEKPETRPAERIPFPAEIDINSIIQVEVLKSRLLPETYDLPLPAESKELKEKRERLVAALRAVADFVRIRTDVMKAKADLFGLPAGKQRGTPQETAVDSRMKLYEKTVGVMSTSLGALWPGDQKMEGILDELLAKGMQKDRGFLQLSGHLQTAIDDVDREYRALTARITLHAYKLRMEAFLDSKGATPVPIHLRGYDRIEERKIEVESRLGLSMSPRAREVFDQASKASFEIAAAANQLLRSEGENREAFSALSSVLGPQLSRLIEDLEVLIREFGNREQLLKRVDDLRAALDALKEQTLPKLKDAGRAAFKTAAEKILADLTTAIDGLKADPQFAAVFTVVPKVRAIRDGLSPWRPETILQILDLAREVQGILENREALLGKLADALGSLEGSVMKEIEKAGAALEDAAAREWKASAANVELARVADLVARLQRTVQTLGSLLNIDKAPVLSHTRSPLGIDVPADEASNTALDLKRTTRIEGDSLTIRTTLLKGQEVVGTPTEAAFIVRRFGWHADFQPGVVLVRPVKVDAGDETFSFAPSVAWLHQYSPRPEETDCWAGFNRFFRPSAGFHAVFLNFVPDKEVEIGLGVSLAFGGDLLVGGAGYNLFGEGGRGERFYFFVGTSLIPLLQKVGVLPAAGAGAKP